VLYWGFVFVSYTWSCLSLGFGMFSWYCHCYSDWTIETDVLLKKKEEQENLVKGLRMMPPPDLQIYFIGIVWHWSLTTDPMSLIHRPLVRLALCDIDLWPLTPSPWSTDHWWDWHCVTLIFDHWPHLLDPQTTGANSCYLFANSKYHVHKFANERYIMPPVGLNWWRSEPDNIMHW